MDEHEDEDEVADLRPNPWPVHGVIVATLVIGYGLLAWAAWPAHHARATGRALDDGLSVLVAVGEGAAAGAIVMGGAGVLVYAAISTALLEYVRNPWLVHGVLLALGALAIVIASS